MTTEVETDPEAENSTHLQMFDLELRMYQHKDHSMKPGLFTHDHGCGKPIRKRNQHAWKANFTSSRQHTIQADMIVNAKAAFLISCIMQGSINAQEFLRYRESLDVPSLPGDRGLEEVVFVIPIVPILIIICICYCCVMNKKNESAGRAPTNAISTKRIPSSTLLLATGAAMKSSPKQAVGVNFTGTDHAQISSFYDNSVFKGSGLVPGMKVVSVNNTIARSAVEARQIVQGISDGPVTILAHSAGFFGATDDLVTATVSKKAPGQSSGVVFKTYPSAPSMVYLSKIDSSTSPFVHTDVAEGMEMVAVNNTPVQSVSQAAELTRQAFPLVTFLARRPVGGVKAHVFAGDVASTKYPVLTATPRQEDEESVDC